MRCTNFSNLFLQ